MSAVASPPRCFECGTLATATTMRWGYVRIIDLPRSKRDGRLTLSTHWVCDDHRSTFTTYFKGEYIPGFDDEEGERWDEWRKWENVMRLRRMNHRALQALMVRARKALRNGDVEALKSLQGEFATMCTLPV